MIIPDPNDPLKQPEMTEVRSLNEPAPTYAAPETPPPYSSSGRVVSSVEPQNYASIEEQPTRHSRNARRKRRKILKCILWVPTFLIFCLLLTIAGPVILEKVGWDAGVIGRVDLPFHIPGKHHGDHSEAPPIPDNRNQDPHNIPNTSNPDALRSLCLEDASWSETVTYATSRVPYFSADVSFQIPATSERLFLISRVAHSSGKIQILDSAIADGIVRVYVTMRYQDPQSKNSTTACLMERFPGEVGVGLFTLGNSRTDTLDFDMVILLPPNMMHNQPHYHILEADLPMFGFIVETKAYFNLFSVKSSGMPIILKPLYAKTAHIETSAAPIIGTFNIESSLSLATSDYPISAEIALDNTHEGSSRLEIQNTNAPIDSSVKLVTPKPDRNTKYAIDITGVNAPVNMSITELPIDASLHSKIETSQEPVSLALPDTYEGTFLLTSSAGHTPVVLRRDHDEESLGRRLVESENQDDRLKGSVVHKEHMTLKSAVYVRTSDASNTLIL
ncbi:hypothetical protein D9758_006311 [Tetrapyrgos nigripes]|uniref:DUF7330 domain-containing protein n=1 Tax=Tetrapyrgos nigripes TaxID=182062 RepID=A0A8H5D8I3_9AGAR|nr:hypothetical protein D9758_006311 [Tetrapyrgos nigripes]